MTVSSTTFLTTHVGDGVTVAFPTGFPFMENGHLAVTRITIAGGARVALSLGTNYTVSGASLSAGGTVTTMGAGSPLTSAYQLEITRATAIVQPADYVANDGADAETMEDGFDRLTMVCQELSGQISAIVTGGTGAFTISNIPGAGVGFYSQLVGNDYQFKRLNPNGPTPQWFAGGAGLVYTDSVDEMRLAVGGRHEMLNPDFFPNEAYRVVMGPTTPLIWTVGSAPDQRHWFWNGGSGSLSFFPVQDDFSGIGTSVLQFTRDAFGAFNIGLQDVPLTVAFPSGAGNVQVAGANVQFQNCNTSFVGTGQVLFNVLAAFNAGININSTLSFNAGLADLNGCRIANVGAFDFNETAKGTTGGAQTFDFSVANCYSITLNAASTWTFTPPAGATTTYIEATQDGTGSRVVTLPAAAKFTLATLAADKLASTGAGKRDLYAFRWNNAGTACLTQIFKDW